jgi:thiol-disulfide isomerase/thioredoxin
MIFLHVTPTSNNSHVLNKHIKDGKDVFVLVYMDGCGPCEATKPEWAQLKHALEKKYQHFNNVVVADVNSKVLKQMHYIKNVQGYPTMLYICKHGKHTQSFENGKQINKERTVDAFVAWIESNVKPYHVVKGGSKKIAKSVKSRKANTINKRNTNKGRKTRRNKRTHAY